MLVVLVQEQRVQVAMAEASAVDGENTSAAKVAESNASLAEIRARGIALLPQSLGEAVDAFEASELLHGALGDTLHREFVRLKRAEWIDYARHVSDWEHARYGAMF